MSRVSLHDMMSIIFSSKTLQVPGGGGGGTQLFFSGRGVRPGFPKCGACELILSLKEGACELKISKFGACELKISKFGGL